MQAASLISAPVTPLANIANLATGQNPPQRILLLRWGANTTPRGPVIVGAKTQQAAALWDSMGFGEIAIDFAHNTVPGHPSYKGEPAPIAAMATPVVIPGEGLVLDKIKWTPEGLRRRGEFVGVDAAVKLDATGEVLMIHSAGLTPTAAGDGLHLLSARLRGEISAEDRAVMKSLGISEATWLRHHGGSAAAPVTTLSVGARGITADERAAMKALGISEATWQRHNGGDAGGRLATLSATIGADLHELACKFLGVSPSTTEARLEELLTVELYKTQVVSRDPADGVEEMLKRGADEARAMAKLAGVSVEELLRPVDDYKLTNDDRRILKMLGIDADKFIEERLNPQIPLREDERRAVNDVVARIASGAILREGGVAMLATALNKTPEEADRLLPAVIPAGASAAAAAAEGDAGGRTDAKPLFEMLGVGGTQALVQVLQQVAGGAITREAGLNTVQIAFGVSKEEAERMIPAQGSAAPVQGAPTALTTLSASLLRLCISKEDRAVMSMLGISETRWIAG